MPVIPLLLFQILGISLAIAYPGCPEAPLLVAAGLLVLGGWRGQSRRVATLFLLMATALMAYLNTCRQTDILRPGHFAAELGLDKSKVVARVEQVVRKRLVLRVVSGHQVSAWKAMDGRLLVFLRSTGERMEYRVGDILVADLQVRSIDKPLHAGGFDFSRYWRFQNLYFQAFANTADLHLLHRPRFHLMRSIRDLQAKSVDKLKAVGPNTFLQEIGPAMILGDKSELTQERQQVFSRAGAMHLLAVSGMHLGIVFLLIRGLGRVLRGRLRWLVEILLIWLYALVTGASASVLRAGLMLSLYTTARSLQRPVQGLQVIGTAAFLLLWQHPFLLMQVGFQLSCLAVLGINFFYRPIKNRLQPRRWIWVQVWNLTALSIAAQLGTLPLSTYYFELIPIYALLSNLLLTPLSSAVLFSGLGVVMLPATDWLQWVPQKVYTLSLTLMETTVNHIAGLPGAGAVSAQLSLLALILAYIGLFVLPWLWQQHRLAAIYIGAILLGMVILERREIDFRQTRQQAWLFFTDNTQVRFARIAGKRGILFHAIGTDTPDYLGQSLNHYGIQEWSEQALPQVQTGQLVRIGIGEQRVALVSSRKELLAALDVATPLIVLARPFVPDALPEDCGIIRLIIPMRLSLLRLAQWKDAVGKNYTLHYLPESGDLHLQL